MKPVKFGVSWERRERMASNWACWSILTTFKQITFWSQFVGFPHFSAILTQWNRSNVQSKTTSASHPRFHPTQNSLNRPYWLVSNGFLSSCAWAPQSLAAVFSIIFVFPSPRPLYCVNIHTIKGAGRWPHENNDKNSGKRLWCAWHEHFKTCTLLLPKPFHVYKPYIL